MSEPEGRPGDGTARPDDRGATGPGERGAPASVASSRGSSRIEVGAEGGDSPGGPGAGPEDTQGQEGDVPQPLEHDTLTPLRLPLFYAQNAARYQREGHDQRSEPGTRRRCRAGGYLSAAQRAASRGQRASGRASALSTRAD